MSNITISVAKQFSETPGGRFRGDGPKSGEAFREDVLYPKLLSHEKVEVNLDDTLGYGSSFLEEAFGGLVRNHGMTAESLKRQLTITSSRKFYATRIWQYIADADVQARK